MDIWRPGIGRERESAAEPMRDAIARALDGALPESDVQAIAAYRAAMTPVSRALGPQLRRLRALGAAGLVAAPASFNVSRHLLHVLDIPVSPTCAITNGDGWPGIIMIGCVTADDGRDRWIASMLRRGAIVVSSDKSAGMMSIGGRLEVGTGRPGLRARLAAGLDLTERLDGATAWSHFVTRMHPPVRLSPGHLPLCHEQPIGTDIIARDGMTGEPLVVRTSAFGGQLIHSVPHWWQESEPDGTELGRRPLASVAAFGDSETEDHGATVGWFGAASVMLACLLTFVDDALVELERHQLGDWLPKLIEWD